MKKIILIVCAILTLANTGKHAFAEEEQVELTATASSCYSQIYSADMALDDRENTFWVGARNAFPWWIMFTADEEKYISKIVIYWYSHYYISKDFDLQVSDDKITWEDIHTSINDEHNQAGNEYLINANTRYVRLYIRNGGGNLLFPVIKEVDIYSSEQDFSRTMRFQGRLSDTQGSSQNDIFNVTFRLYDADTGGSPLWEELQQGVSIEEGILDVELGSVTLLDCAFDKQYWLSVEIDSDGEMIPRFKLNAVPYAIKAEQ